MPASRANTRRPLNDVAEEVTASCHVKRARASPIPSACTRDAIASAIVLNGMRPMRPDSKTSRSRLRSLVRAAKSINVPDNRGAAMISSSSSSIQLRASISSPISESQRASRAASELSLLAINLSCPNKMLHPGGSVGADRSNGNWAKLGSKVRTKKATS